MKELSLINCRLDRRYDIQEQLSRGSYAEIYIAKDTVASPQSPHSTVVIKALNVFLQDDLDDDLERTLVENFQNEAVALDRVRHPNIISRMGHGTARDLKGTAFHYLVLEYMAGGDIQALVRKDKPSVVKGLDYIEQVCAGLGHAHASGIIHRDIKPQNLLLNAEKTTVKIADFGVARVTISDSPITRVGTNIYAPPEHSPVFAGQTGNLASHKLSPASDIYSLAKTVYTMVTGDSPRHFANGPITSLPSAYENEDWADELLKVLKKATNDDHLERQQTVTAFWSDLSVVQRMASEGDSETVIKRVIETPQPHVSKGYSAVPPTLPDFEATPVTNPGLRLPLATAVAEPARAGHSYKTTPGFNVNSNGAVSMLRPEYLPNKTRPVEVRVVQPKKRTFFRRAAIFMIALMIFTGMLWGTASYMRGKGILPGIKNPFKTPTAVANADVYLRPGPSTEGTAIGLVTKNSKLRIVNSQNNWYQVDVVEQGRVNPANSGQNATKGWVNGKYLDISDN